jgi:hypothetical protein
MEPRPSGSHSNIRNESYQCMTWRSCLSSPLWRSKAGQKNHEPHSSVPESDHALSILPPASASMSQASHDLIILPVEGLATAYKSRSLKTHTNMSKLSQVQNNSKRARGSTLGRLQNQAKSALDGPHKPGRNPVSLALLGYLMWMNMWTSYALM